MSSVKRTLTILGTGAIALGITAPSALGAGFESETATFEARLKGVQITEWTTDETRQPGCHGSPRVGHGTERITFRSTWVRMRLRSIGSGYEVVSFLTPRGTKRPEWKVSGTVDRKTTNIPATVRPECVVADGDGTYVPKEKDCGKKSFKGLEIAPAVRVVGTKRTKMLAIDQLNKPKTPRFAECWIEGFAWPSLLQNDDKNKNGVVVPLAPRSVFRSPRNGKAIWIGRATKTNRSFGRATQTKIEWSITARKIRTKR
ncbi:MAG: hypothetical protein AB7G37_01905 [Solirubrobacteraceae bacterium]